MLLLLAACLHTEPAAPPASPGASLGACPVFPPADPWNQRVDGLPADPTWTDRLQRLVGDARLHPDFGNYVDPPIEERYGIPYNVVPADQPLVPVTYDAWPEESDAGPFPLPGPDAALIEGGTPRACDGDCHLLVVQEGACRLFEGYACRYEGGWVCANGAAWDLRAPSPGQRPEGWTSADAAGLPIFAGLARYDEVAAGEVAHALRFTVHCTADAHVPPATHHAVPRACRPGEDAIAPPMGLRVRLRADVDLSGFSPDARVLLTAMQRYGLILADNGSDLYVQSALDPRWGEAVDELKQVPASAFEVVAPGGP